jgi:acetyl-CoA C-acetyltransferase
VLSELGYGLMHEMMRRGGGTGVAAICGGLSQGEAVLLKV